MISKYFLALDYPKDEIIPKGIEAIDFIEKEFGSEFVKKKIGVKLNDYSLRKDFAKFSAFKERGCEIFADVKIFHGANTGYKIIEEIKKELPVDYVTVATQLGRKILGEYVERAKSDNIKIIGFTAHTKIPAEQIREIHNQEAESVIYTLGKIASESGCDAIVLEAGMLKNEKIRELPVKKLIAGIRTNIEERGVQARVTLLRDLQEVKEFVDYIVISSRYVHNWEKLREIICKLE